MARIIEGAADWRGPDMAKSTAWIHDWTKDEIAEIERAFASASKAGKTLDTLTREDFPLLRSSRCRGSPEGRERLENGGGLQLFRGFPNELQHQGRRSG